MYTTIQHTVSPCPLNHGDIGTYTSRYSPLSDNDLYSQCCAVLSSFNIIRAEVSANIERNTRSNAGRLQLHHFNFYTSAVFVQRILATACLETACNSATASYQNYIYTSMVYPHSTPICSLPTPSTPIEDGGPSGYKRTLSPSAPLLKHEGAGP